jgi:hypothetical protein
MGEVRALPRRTCFSCRHYVLAWCGLFQEPIDSELFAARNCVDYEVES